MRNWTKKEQTDREHYFRGKSFSCRDIYSLPTTPGVYGFKDREGNFIYIGKAKNLRRRITGYFREIEESPRKLKLIHEESVSLSTYPCGSELECLIYEYRLIKKYKPKLNKQTSINERNGQFSPVDNCIVLLPHTDNDKVMSFWFRRDQKIQMKALNSTLSTDDVLLEEVKEFFFAEKLVAENCDFPEMEIAVRWLKKHRDMVPVMPVYRMGSAEEICENLKYYRIDAI